MQLVRSRLQKVGRAGLYLFNGVVIVFLAWIAAVNLFGFPYHLGVDGQKARCLPWSVFIVKKSVPVEVRQGDLLQFRVDGIGHGFDGLLFVKMVGAIPGDRVEIRGDELFVNGSSRGKLWLIKTLKKRPGDFDRVFVVPPDEYLMLGTTPESFDGRYWGTVKKEQILGSAYPIF